MLPGFIIPTAAPYGGASWWWACLLPPSAASMFAGALVNWELVSQGINAHTLTLPVRGRICFLDVWVQSYLAVIEGYWVIS